jgi:hypothetical protein
MMARSVVVQHRYGHKQRERSRFTVSARVSTCVLPAMLLSFVGCTNSEQNTSPKPRKQVASELKLAEWPELRSAIMRSGESVSKCMRAQGFRYYPGDIPPESMVFQLSPLLEDETLKRTIGYGITDQINGSQQGPAGPNLSAELTPAGNRELVRCGENAAKAFPALRQMQELVDSFSEETQASIEADETLRSLRARWSACMREKGLKFDTPFDVRTLLYEEIDDIISGDGTDPVAFGIALAKLRKRELTLARADADCSDPIAEERDRIIAGYLGGASKRIPT